MGSTGEAEKKRRHVISISPAVLTTKKQPFMPLSEEKKLDAVVLQFQNKKLLQKLETQKIEINALEDKLCQLRDKQYSYEKSLAVIDNSWKKLVDHLESDSKCALENTNDVRGFGCHLAKEDGDSPLEDALRSRLLETGATESSTVSALVNRTEDRKINGEMAQKSETILKNIVASFDNLNNLKSVLYTTSLKALSSNGQSQKVVSSDLLDEVRNLRMGVLKLHLKHKSLAGELQTYRDTDAKNKADLKCLKGELESTISQLEESNNKLAILKSKRDLARGASCPSPNQGNKHMVNDKARDRESDLQDMESTLKEILDCSTSRLNELKSLHEDRLNTLRNLSRLQSNLKNIHCICSSQSYLLLKDQLAKAKADVVQYQALYEKLQVEKECLYWREKESFIKNEFVDVLQQSSAVADSRVSDLEAEIEKYRKEKDSIEAKLEEASKEPGRKEIIAEFKALVTSFPERMGGMETQLAKHKETAADIHSLRADVESLTNILNHKAKEFETLTFSSTQQNAEIQKLQAVISDLKVTKTDLKLFLDTYGHQSADSREVGAARSTEIKAWAHVKGIKSSLDERNLELRVKVAIEAEAKAQQKLAASEAEIAELRKNLEASKRQKATLSDILKSKHEETEAYLSEIETIGQAYDDMQSQNQQLLHQITERDDYNVKLVLEGVRSRQMGDALLGEKRMLEKSVHHTKKTVEFYDFKACQLEDQLKTYSDQRQRLTEDRAHNATAVESTKSRLLDVRKSSKLLMGTVEEVQARVDGSRVCLTEMQIEQEKERFERKRVEEDLDNMRRTCQQLKSQVEGSSVVEKLQQELQEYKEILKCSVCLDRRKEVVITKCYHLFCNPCLQRIIETRHRKCPVCMASFGVNDVKPVYI